MFSFRMFTLIYTDIWGWGGESGMKHVRGSSIIEYPGNTVNTVKKG